MTLRYDTAMASGGRQRMEATVRDLGGRALAGAAVSLRILPQDGGLFVETSMRDIAVTTDAMGAFAATYEAPAIPAGYRDIALEVVANHEIARHPVQRAFLVTVFAAAERFLSFRISLPAGDLTLPDAPLPLRIEVRNHFGEPATDARVEAVVSPTNGTLTRTNGTAAEMASLVFSPPPDLGADTSYVVALKASLAGYHSANASVPIFVAYGPTVGPPPLPTFPTAADLGLIVGVSLVVAVAIVAAALLVRRRSRPPR